MIGLKKYSQIYLQARNVPQKVSNVCKYCMRRRSCLHLPTRTSPLIAFICPTLSSTNELEEEPDVECEREERLATFISGFPFLLYAPVDGASLQGLLLAKGSSHDVLPDFGSVQRSLLCAWLKLFFHESPPLLSPSSWRGRFCAIPEI